MPRWHQEHQPGAQAVGHILTEPLQAPGDVVMHPPGMVPGVKALGERDEPALGQDARRQLLLSLRLCGHQ